MGFLPHPRVCALVAALLCSGGPPLFGQTADVHAAYVAGRLGANLERTDPGGRHVGRSWRIVWLLFHRALGCRNGGLDFGIHHGPSVRPPVPAPPFLNTPGPCGPGQFRDLQLTASAVRHFGGDSIHPYLLVGAAKLWTQIRTPLGDWTNNESVYPQGGVGLVIPLSSRLALVPEVRLDYLVLGGILRANVAVVYRLH